MTAHVLFARLDSDGDVLLTGPAVRAVAASAARVTFLSSPRSAAAAALLPGVDSIRTFDAPWIAAEPPPVDSRVVLEFVAEMAALQIDQAVISTSFHQSPLPLALLLRMAGVATIAAISVDYPGSLLDIRHQVRGQRGTGPDDMHEVERNLSLVATLGYRLPRGDDDRMRIVVPPGTVAPDLPSRFVVVHPGASVPARAWMPRRNRELVAALARRGYDVVVTGGPGERELCAEVAGSDGIDLSGKVDLAALALVLQRADAVVVGNTGPAHIAAAVGTPVVSIFAPTVPAARWKPWRVPLELFGFQEIGCSGCRARTCPLPAQPCISGIATSDVVRAVERLAGAVARAPVIDLTTTAVPHTGAGRAPTAEGACGS